eukprot:COSAG03_NODE_1439_length_4078_cov_12.055782_2_plen_91_part_00
MPLSLSLSVYAVCVRCLCTLFVCARSRLFDIQNQGDKHRRKGRDRDKRDVWCISISSDTAAIAGKKNRSNPRRRRFEFDEYTLLHARFTG